MDVEVVRLYYMEVISMNWLDALTMENVERRLSRLEDNLDILELELSTGLSYVEITRDAGIIEEDSDE